jgi:hypothetical protein
VTTHNNNDSNNNTLGLPCASTLVRVIDGVIKSMLPKMLCHILLGLKREIDTYRDMQSSVTPFGICLSL